MGSRIYSSRIAALVATLLLSLAAFQTAFAADGLEAAGSDGLAGESTDGALMVQDVALVAQDAKWRTIMTPEQLRMLYSTSDGFGPGNYRIGADFTLGEKNAGEDIGTCALLSGSYVIDFNGHTVQSSCENLATFTVQGADVTFMDSKATSDKVSVNALGLGCIEVRDGTSVSGSKGSATIEGGNYLCTKFTDAGGGAVFCAGGALTVNGGSFQGSQAAISTSGGTTVVNGGAFYGGYPWALLYFGGDTKIVRGTFYGGKNYYGAMFAMGAYTAGQAFDMSSLLASGSTWDNPDQVYYNGASQTSSSPGLFYPYAAAMGSTVVVTGPQTIAAANKTKTFGDKAFNLGAKTDGDGKLSYSSSDAKVATVDSSGNVTIKGTGATNITIKASETPTSRAASKTITLTVNRLVIAAPSARAGLVYNGKVQTGIAGGAGCSVKGGSATNAGSHTATLTADANHVFKGGKAEMQVKWSIAKAPQKIAAKNASASVKAKKFGKVKALAKNVTVNLKKKAKASAKTTVAYRKANKAGGKLIAVNKKTGKVTLKKGLKAGTYKVKVKLTADANKNYKAAKAKTITLTVKVK